MEDMIKIPSSRHPRVALRIIPGHFVTPNSHINYYMDMTMLKARQNEAGAVAHAMSEAYSTSSIIDTIICLDGCEVIGAYLAEELTKAGVLSKNAHKTIYVVSPEYDSSGMIIFRENSVSMVRGKNVLFVVASATTGQTIGKFINAVSYYGAHIVGVSAIFSVATKIHGVPIHALFTGVDVPDYHTYPSEDCPLCKAGKPVDALANGYGYSRL